MPQKYLAYSRKRNNCNWFRCGYRHFDPEAQRQISAKTHHMNVDYNPYEGWEVTGEPVSVLVRGEYVIKNKEFVGVLGSGRYIKRPLKQ